jgi:hypothetical protein
LHEAIIKGDSLFCRGIAGGCKIERRREHVTGLEAHVGGADLQKAADHDTCARQQNNGQSHFSRDQQP